MKDKMSQHMYFWYILEKGSPAQTQSTALGPIFREENVFYLFQIFSTFPTILTKI